MSYVTGFTLITAPEEGGVEKVRGWLLSKDPKWTLGDDLSFLGGGNKHPQNRLLHSSGFNNFDVDGFTEFFATIEWDSPGEAIVVLQTEIDAAKVLRPKGWWSEA